jgi:hypothetical protein
MNYHNVTTQISYDQTKLTNVTETKFLGLIIDSTLSWKQHIDYVIKKISIACYALRNIKYFIPLDTLKLIYFAHIHSIIRYGIIIWSGSSCVNKVCRLHCIYRFFALSLPSSILNSQKLYCASSICNRFGYFFIILRQELLNCKTRKYITTTYNPFWCGRISTTN